MTLYRGQRSRSSPSKRNVKSKMAVLGGLTNSSEKRSEKEKYTYLNAAFQRTAKTDKKVFLSDP